MLVGAALWVIGVLAIIGAAHLLGWW